MSYAENFIKECHSGRVTTLARNLRTNDIMVIAKADIYKDDETKLAVLNVSEWGNEQDIDVRLEVLSELLEYEILLLRIKGVNKIMLHSVSPYLKPREQYNFYEKMGFALFKNADKDRFNEMMYMELRDEEVS